MTSKVVLGILLGAFWLVFYIALFFSQPVPSQLPERDLPGFGSVKYGQAPPWPAVEWNIWDGWRDAIPLQVAFYILFLCVTRGIRMRRLSGQGCHSLHLAIIGIAFGAVLRGVLGIAVTVCFVSCIVKLVGSTAPCATMRYVWIAVLVMMQLVFSMLTTDDASEPCYLEQLFPSLAALPSILRIQGAVSWSTFRYDALRLISYAADVTDNQADSNDLSMCLAYVLYPPLMPAGPVICYADFVSQLRMPRPRSSRWLAMYLLKTLALIFVLEASLYFFFFPAWFGPLFDDLQSLSPWVIFGAAHYVLHFEWLSLMIIWRVPRLIALLDCIDTPENMTGMISFPASFRDVWRLWHASLNQWCTKYIYRPLGGRRNAVPAVFATFLFIGFWHDIRGIGDRPFWYVWALLNGGFLLLENSLNSLFCVSKPNSLFIATRGAIVVFALMLANLPALMYSTSFSIMSGICTRADSWIVLVVLATVFGMGALFTDGQGRASSRAA